MFAKPPLDPFLHRIHPATQEITENNKLAHLRFGVKSVIGVKGYPYSFGNSIWDNMHRKNINSLHAHCVSKAVAEGALLTGILHTSEFAFNILGSNSYGVPRNPRVPTGYPGGSSSGCAVAVAENTVDFAFCTDTGGSSRIPAAFCGVWSLRPTFGAISLHQVLPVGAHYDTLGIMAKDAVILNRVGEVVLSNQTSTEPMNKFYLILEAFALCKPDVKQNFLQTLKSLESFYTFEWISMDHITCETDPTLLGMNGWKNASMLLLLDTWETENPWLQENIKNWHDKDSPLCSETRDNFMSGEQIAALVASNPVIKTTTSARIAKYKVALERFLDGHACIVIPTTPFTAPTLDEALPPETLMNMISLTAISSLTGFPQVSMPVLTDRAQQPLGLSLLGGAHQDLALLNTAVNIGAQLAQVRSEEDVSVTLPYGR